MKLNDIELKPISLIIGNFDNAREEAVLHKVYATGSFIMPLKSLTSKMPEQRLETIKDTLFKIQQKGDSCPKLIIMTSDYLTIKAFSVYSELTNTIDKMGYYLINEKAMDFDLIDCTDNIDTIYKEFSKDF